MRVESSSFYSINNPALRRSGQIADAEEIKAILFLGIKSDIPIKDRKRKVDIII